MWLAPAVATVCFAQAVVESLAPAEAAAPSPEAIEASIRRGIDLLVARQNDNGSWGSAFGSRDPNLFAPAPGAHHAFRAAVTSLCIAALIESGDPRDEVARAIDRGEAWLVKHVRAVRRAGPVSLYNNWAHAYAISALAHLHGRHDDDAARREELKELIAQQIDMLGRYECIDGGWTYYDNEHLATQQPSGSSLSFITATVLVAMDEARQIGVEVPQKTVDRAMESIRRQRKSDFSYLYGEYLKHRPMWEVNRPAGSLGRSQACNLAMFLWDDPKTTRAIIQQWLDRLLDRNLWLDMGRKRPIPHESWFAVAGYFFYYGHYYAAGCIDQLEPADRPCFQGRLAELLMALQEKDGSWWDFPMYDYHQQYGTALAVMSLVRCRPSAAR